MAVFNGTSGHDIFTGGSADDTAVGNGGNDSLSGGDGNDLLVGNSGSDTLNGGNGSDRLFSGDESPPYNLPYYGNPYTPPLLDTGSEVDTLNGGGGSDIIFAGSGDNIDGGADDGFGDYLFISFQGATSGVTVDFRLVTQTVGGGTITGVENISWVEGSNFDDNINVASYSGSGYSDFTAVFGMGGNDQLTAGYYTGVLDGGDGNDIVDGRGSQYLQAVYGGAGDDTLYTNSNTFGLAFGGDGHDTIYAHGETHGGNGNDTIVMSFSYYAGRVYGDAGDDQIDAAAQGNSIAGGSGADTINGNSGADMLGSGDFADYPDIFADDVGLEQDVLAGFGGDDLLSAGYGDSVDGGSGSDTLRLCLGGATAGVTFSTAGIVAGGPFTFAGGTIHNIETLEYLRGSEFNDTLTAVTQDSLLVIEAGAGDDVITSHNSSVDVRGGDGDDRFVSGAAGDLFDGGSGSDTVDYGNSSAGVNLTLADVGASYGPGGDEIRNVENIVGSDHNDVLGGDSSTNSLYGSGGNDFIIGAGGNDLLSGGAGNDRLAGGDGNDRLIGGSGIDFASYYDASSGVTVNLGLTGWQDTIASGTDNLSGIENVAGSAFADTLTGDAFANRLEGWSGDDVLFGSGGDDFILGGSGDDQIDGGDGTDTATYVDSVAGVEVDLRIAGPQDTGNGMDVLTNIENVSGSGQADRLTGNSGANVLYGHFGNDRLVALAGNDILDGGTGIDAMRGGSGDDTYYVDNVSDSVIENSNEGTDTVYSSASFSLRSNVENLVLTGSALRGNGNNLDNVITGNNSDNILNGGLGADTMSGDLGNDTYFIDNAGDTVVEAAEAGRERVYTTISLTLGDNLEDLFARGSSAINLTGNDLDNVLRGNSAGNILDGGAGADDLKGGGGADTFLFDDGDFGGLTPSTCDRIIDFTRSDGDRIDLSAVDASSLASGDQAFSFIGTAAFSGAAGELRYEQVGANTYVYGDTDGDGAADIMLRLDGTHALVGGDFVI